MIGESDLARPEFSHRQRRPSARQSRRLSAGRWPLVARPPDGSSGRRQRGHSPGQLTPIKPPCAQPADAASRTHGSMHPLMTTLASLRRRRRGTRLSYRVCCSVIVCCVRCTRCSGKEFDGGCRRGSFAASPRRAVAPCTCRCGCAEEATTRGVRLASLKRSQMHRNYRPPALLTLASGSEDVDVRPWEYVPCRHLRCHNCPVSPAGMPDHTLHACTQLWQTGCHILSAALQVDYSCACCTARQRLPVPSATVRGRVACALFLLSEPHCCGLLVAAGLMRTW